MLLELLHGLLHVLLLVSVSVDHVVVFLLQDLKLVLKLFDGLGVFFMFFSKKLVLVEISLKLAEFDFEGFDLVQVLLV